MSKFSTRCFRNFKKFIGELTANSAGVYIAIQHTNKIGLKYELDDPWSHIANEFGIKINGLQTNDILKSAVRLNIVNVYSGFDLYLLAYRKEYFNLIQTEWKADKSKTPFDEFRININLDEIEKSSTMLPHQLKLIDYYRLARNAIVHPSVENTLSASNFFIKETHSLQIVREHYKMVSAPNNFDCLNFHDVKLFSRTLLDILPLFDEKLDPGNERLKEIIPVKNWLNYKESRKRNYEIGFLQSSYGISKERSEEILAH